MVKRKKRKLDICNACLIIRTGRNHFKDSENEHIQHTCKKTTSEINDLMVLAIIKNLFRSNDIEMW